MRSRLALGCSLGACMNDASTSIETLIRSVADFPKPGITFRDIAREIFSQRFVRANPNHHRDGFLRHPDGRKLMDQIEGFRQYLDVAEESRLEYLNPPKKTPELFEKFLPYAIALDCEKTINKPNSMKTRTIGTSQYFFSCARNSQNSPITRPLLIETSQNIRVKCRLSR